MRDTLKKILVVDDDAANLTLINGILRGLYKIYPITSGMDALEFLKKWRPDLIFMDVEMPEMNGYELFDIIKSKPDLRDIPVVFLTGNTDEESKLEALQLGVTDYLHKPINDVVMLDCVQNLMAGL